jgi:small subunit ribosomal protein S12
MATLIQRLKINASRKKDNARTRGLLQCPQARGWVHRLTIVTPRKPNSAKRPVIKVLLKKMGRLTAHIPGIGHTLKKYSKVLLRGRGPRDLPGVRYSGVRGVLDFIGLKRKKRRRSIYGAEQNDFSKIRARRKYRVAIRVAENTRIRKEQEEEILTTTQMARENLIDLQKLKKYIGIQVNTNLTFNVPLTYIKKRRRKIPFFFTALSKYLFYIHFFQKYNFFLISLFLSNLVFYKTCEKLKIHMVFLKKKQGLPTNVIVYNDRIVRYECLVFFKKHFIFRLAEASRYVTKMRAIYLTPKKILKNTISDTKNFTEIKATLNVKNSKASFLKKRTHRIHLRN